jgi:hypothetical protein
VKPELASWFFAALDTFERSICAETRNSTSDTSSHAATSVRTQRTIRHGLIRRRRLGAGS